MAILVLKIGTSSICDEKTHFPRLSSLSILVETIVQLRNSGNKVVLVTSGAVGIGLTRLGLEKRPKHLSQVQAVAAVGQGRLMSLYDQLFSNFQVPIAQVLLTRENLSHRGQYLNACNTLKELLSMDVLPIINENDTISNAEIRFGDNDTLSAIAASMVSADFLFLLTDVDALYTDNPRKNPNATRIPLVSDINQIKSMVDTSTGGSLLGTGGMTTKLIAAELATSMGCTTVITLGSIPQRIPQLIKDYERYKTENTAELPIATFFAAKDTRLVDRKFWIRNGLLSHGTIFIDKGAVESIVKHKKSLFAAGIYKVQGVFGPQQSVSICALVEENGQVKTVEVARGLSNYSNNEVAKLVRANSKDIEQILGYMDSEWVVHRDNLVITCDSINLDSVLNK